MDFLLVYLGFIIGFVFGTVFGIKMTIKYVNDKEYQKKQKEGKNGFHKRRKRDA